MLKLRYYIRSIFGIMSDLSIRCSGTIYLKVHSIHNKNNVQYTTNLMGKSSKNKIFYYYEHFQLLEYSFYSRYVKSSYYTKIPEEELNIRKKN